MSAEFGGGKKDYPSVLEYLQRLFEAGETREDVESVVSVSLGLGQLSKRTANAILRKFGAPVDSDDLDD